MSTGPAPVKKRFPNDDKAKIAETRALVEIDKLDKLLVSMGHPVTSPIERMAVLTYIKAKDLGLLDA